MLTDLRFKPIYVILLFLIPVFGVGFLLVNRTLHILGGQELIVVVGIVALTISIISLAIADSNPQKLKVQLDIWSQKTPDQDGYFRCFWKLTNNSNIPLSGFKVYFRYPRNLYKRPSVDHGHQDKFYDMERYLIVINDKYDFIGGKDYVEYQHDIRLNHLKQGEIKISVVANNHQSKTYLISKSQSQKILHATEQQKLLI